MTIRRLNNKKPFVMPVVEEVNIVPCDVIATSCTNHGGPYPRSCNCGCWWVSDDYALQIGHWVHSPNCQPGCECCVATP